MSQEEVNSVFIILERAKQKYLLDSSYRDEFTKILGNCFLRLLEMRSKDLFAKSFIDTYLDKFKEAFTL